jgi:hypothetical protein
MRRAIITNTHGDTLKSLNKAKIKYQDITINMII